MSTNEMMHTEVEMMAAVQDEVRRLQRLAGVRCGVKFESDYVDDPHAYPAINVSFKVRGTTAGKARHNPRTNTTEVDFNRVLMRENFAEFMARTVPHEVAHIVTGLLYRGMASAHGPEWRRMCRLLGMRDVTRCHSYDVSSVRRTVKKYATTCACPGVTHMIGPKRRARLMRNPTAYHCIKCKQYIKLV
jgi:SprT protein